MMYKLIDKALKAVGSDNKPTDYLSFFCLGKKQLEEVGTFPEVFKPIIDRTTKVIELWPGAGVLLSLKIIFTNQPYVFRIFPPHFPRLARTPKRRRSERHDAS